MYDDADHMKYMNLYVHTYFRYNYQVYPGCLLWIFQELRTYDYYYLCILLKDALGNAFQVTCIIIFWGLYGTQWIHVLETISSKDKKRSREVIVQLLLNIKDFSVVPMFLNFSWVTGVRWIFKILSALRLNFEDLLNVLLVVG